MTTIDVRTLARAVADDLAPMERPAVDSLLDVYADDYEVLAKQLRGGAGADLGFGVADAMALAPYVVHAAAVAVGWLGSQVLAGLGSPIRESSAGIARTIWRRIRRERRPTTVTLVAPLQPAQLEVVREAIVSMARHDGLAQEQAEIIARAVVGVLAQQKPVADAQ